MSFGGFLGIGESYHPLPWRVLDYDTGMGGYVVDLGKEKLRGAPSFSRDELRTGTGNGGRGWTTTTACRPTGVHEPRSFAASAPGKVSMAEPGERLAPPAPPSWPASLWRFDLLTGHASRDVSDDYGLGYPLHVLARGAPESRWAPPRLRIPFAAEQRGHHAP